MKLTGLHLLLSYQCTYECDHCFAWGSPFQSGTFTLEKLRDVFRQAKDLGTVQWIYFEGGEPFLYYGLMLQGIREAVEMGFKVGVVSNGYWATGLEDAVAWLKPLVGLVQDLTVSSDLYHYDEKLSLQARYASQAARQLGIPIGEIAVAQPEATDSVHSAVGQLPLGESAVMYRGRAVDKLVPRASLWDPQRYTTCPHEDLREPGRVHLDALGNLHVCQGIVIGNLFQSPLTEICASYDPDLHPITGPLLAGGPVGLAQRYDLPLEPAYADACHLCYQTRVQLRERFPEALAPDQMYGKYEKQTA